MGTGTSALSDIYTKLLGDSARTVTTAPANAAFQGSSGMPIAQDTTAVPAIVRDTYNEALAATRRTTSTGLSAAGAAPAFAASSVHAVVKFANGSSVVQRRYNQTLKQIADQHKAQGGIIRVVGHASSRTQNLPVARHNIVNFRISVDRAQSVAKALMRLGVSHNAILIIAKSDAEPAFLEAMPKGEAENRRTEIFLDF
jgi:outer membrane protein OmpA-like peptidoglycan-associated protein